MPGFRILDQFPAYLDRLGLPASGGRLDFFETGTDTPKDVYGNPDLTVNNGSTVLIGTDGRTVKDIWGDGVYRVRLYAADDTLIAEADTVQIPGGSGTVIPPLDANKFLTNDGATLLWQLIRQLPDPSGNAQKILSNDGANPVWIDRPSVPTPEVTPNVFAFGGFLIQWGTATAPSSGTRRTTVPVAFPRPFKSAPIVPPPNQPTSINPAGLIGTSQASSVGPNGFTASFDANIDNTGSSFNITSPFPFNWIAFGLAAT